MNHAGALFFSQINNEFDNCPEKRPDSPALLALNVHSGYIASTR
jgi:hypothetical protein